jgi:hypothetical protein
MKPVYFYVLKCPMTNDIKYVGRSVQPKVRYRQHIHSGKKDGSKDRKGAWIKSLLDKDLKPIMEIIDKIENYKDIEDVKRREEFLILEYRKKYDIKNDRDIVENGYIFSEEARKKMSDSQKGNTNRKGKKASKETVEKISIARKGKKHPASFFEKTNKPILQYDKEFNFIKEWESCTAASIALKINQRNISSSTNINSNRKSAGGFIWRYKFNN